MHPDLHRVHHERYDCNFPILTGWTNRYVQFLYEASVRCGLVDTGLGQKPTAIGPTKSCSFLNSSSPLARAHSVGAIDS